MFWLKTQSRTEKKLSQMQNLLIRSFSNVKNDTQKLFQWLNYLYQKGLDQENQIKQLKLELSYIPKKPEDIRKIVDSYYSFDNIMERIKMLNEKVDNLAAKGVSTEPLSAQTHPEIHEISKRLAQLEEQKRATIRDKVVKRITRNSKEYVKNLMLSYIRKYTQIGALQLKDMVVYDQGLCSKSSFYRLLDEIEALEDIGTVKKGKQKYYLYKQLKEQ
jgi:tetrahydromethanopterin S-methyltransferase subunit G